MQILRCSALVVLCTVLFSGNAIALSPYSPGSTGIDVSWPEGNCRIVEQPLPKDSFAIVGVNHGLDFTGNTCLNQEASRFSDYSLYLNTGYPGLSYGRKYQFSPNYCSWNDNQCLAFNYGFNAVRFSLHYAAVHDVHTTRWWLDVETDNSWTTNSSTNVASLRGMMAALKKYTLFPSIGFYSAPDQWSQLTGNWQNHLSVWAATGTTDRSSALLACHETSFTGGKITLAQYTLKLDQDYACSSNATN